VARSTSSWSVLLLKVFLILPRVSRSMKPSTWFGVSRFPDFPPSEEELLDNPGSIAWVVEAGCMLSEVGALACGRQPAEVAMVALALVDPGTISMRTFKLIVSVED
jgi:hypothetical protein